MKNKLRKALLENEITLGGWMQIGHPACAEIFAKAGFDWICVDMEHGAIDLETLANICRTIDAFDCVPVARIPVNDPVWIHRCLDAGVRGLIIPMINSAAEAQQAVSNSKYPPMGVRGFGFCRANMHGMDFDSYVKNANDEIAIILQIEHKDAIDNLDDIAKVEGVDSFFIGPLDLSGSMNITGQLDHPDMKRALNKYLRVCESYNISAGLHIVSPNDEEIDQAIEHGYNLLALGLDVVFLAEKTQEILKATRSKLSFRNNSKLETLLYNQIKVT